MPTFEICIEIPDAPGGPLEAQVKVIIIGGSGCTEILCSRPVSEEEERGVMCAIQMAVEELTGCAAIYGGSERFTNEADLKLAMRSYLGGGLG
jgi:hypothetical protein